MLKLRMSLIQNVIISLSGILGTMLLHRVCGIFVVFSVCLISFAPPCNGGNILVFPVDGSHWINMKILLEELHARGHSITVMRASTSWYIAEKSPVYTSITLEMKEDLENFFDAYLQAHMKVCYYGLGPMWFIHSFKYQDNHNVFYVLFFRHRERGLQRSLSSNSPKNSFP